MRGIEFRISTPGWLSLQLAGTQLFPGPVLLRFAQTTRGVPLPPRVEKNCTELSAVSLSSLPAGAAGLSSFVIRSYVHMFCPYVRVRYEQNLTDEQNIGAASSVASWFASIRALFA